MVSELALQIFDTTDPRFMRILDLSCYNPKIEVHAERLSVIAPGSYTEIFYPVKAGFSELVNTVNLSRTETPGNLIDGIYTINYSIAPNDKLWVEYLHLRTTNIMQRYFTALCSLQVDCNLDRDKDEKLDELRKIRMLIDAAKAYVEYCGAPEKGKKIYQFALDRLGKLECSMQNCRI